MISCLDYEEAEDTVVSTLLAVFTRITPEAGLFKLDELTPESAILWRSYCEYLKKQV
jgi:hypothetical protein